MTTAALAPSNPRTVDELLHQLGDVPASRVRLNPAPGHATVQDVIDVHQNERLLCELVDGTLVEKPMGYRESMIAGALIALLRAFVIPRNLGIVTGESGMMKLFAGLVRIPDVAYASWNRLPGRKVPTEPVPSLAPDLAVEVLSAGNTPREMSRKRREYFDAGVRLVWIINLDDRTSSVYTAADQQPLIVSESQSLDGGEVLPGFTLPLRDLFAELDRQA
jgi:Uma2 family endonuclease